MSRMDQVNENVRRELGQILLKEMQESGLSGFVSIMRVKTSPDLRAAAVYISVIGDEDVEQYVRELNKKRTLFQKELGSRISMKFTPRLVFKIDPDWQKTKYMDDLLDKETSTS